MQSATAEACAIAKALEWTYRQKVDRDITIYKDSLSVLKALQNNKIMASTNFYILEIKKWYFTIMENSNRKRKIVMAWIPAHKGIVGNEEADKLAKEATRGIKQ